MNRHTDELVLQFVLLSQLFCLGVKMHGSWHLLEKRGHAFEVIKERYFIFLAQILTMLFTLLDHSDEVEK